MALDLGSYIKEILNWYRSLTRPFLINVESQKVSEFDADIHRLESRERRVGEELVACFLGNSGVGKSTLINALVAGKEILLPAGGVGPLTAQALTVCYGERPRFEVRYHSPQNLWQLVFGLEQIHKKDSAIAIQVEVENEGPLQELDSDQIEEIQRELYESEEVDATAHVGQRQRREEFKKQAQLMVKGNQDANSDLPYLVDSLRSVGGWPRVWGTQPLEEDQPRLRRLQKALSLAKANQIYRGSYEHDKTFREDLKAHASGFLAPLIKDLRVFWDSPLLRQGLAFVDLPGIGVAGDVYREVTHYWIREKARAVVLVVDSRGITESSATLLYQSGFLNSLLFSAEDPADDPVLIIAVVKIDDIAETRYSEERSRKKVEHFREVCSESAEKVRAQIDSELQKTWSLQQSDGSEQKRQVIENILSTLQVHPVSAIQYRRLLRGDEDDRPFITQVDESNIPGFIKAMEDLVVARRARIEAALQESTRDFFFQVIRTLNLIRAQWQEETRAKEEADLLRTDLFDFIKPKQKEFYSRQGAYREFLKNTIPQQIEALVGAASIKAEKEINNYLDDLQNAHWSTLRAAVRRGGTFYGARHINLPTDFAFRFEEPVAEVWSKKILKGIRTNTKDFADDCVHLVEELVRWAKDQGTRVSPALIEAQRDAILADARKLDAVGKEMVEELRESVKVSLIKSIEAPIKKKCVDFVNKGDDIGRGVKSRILQLFRDLAENVVAAAADPAIQLLVKHFRSVEEEIRVVLKQYEDPLLSVAEVLVASHENRLRRSDAQRRKTILEEVAIVLSHAPKSPTVAESDSLSVSV